MVSTFPLFRVENSLYFTVAVRGRMIEGCKVGTKILERFNTQSTKIVPVEDAKVEILTHITALQRAVQEGDIETADHQLDAIQVLLSYL